ncbi:MAG TPA: L,D-transpeptidase family protein [Rhizomicrobium sp.]|nr:L,D-transpeptidase family protein [Rhizomicrobium sp.]
MHRTASILRRKYSAVAAVAAAACALIFLGAAGPGDAPADETARDLRTILSTGKLPELNDGELDFAALRAFYAAMAYKPVWSGSATAENESRTMLAALSRAPDDGLDASDYHAGTDVLRRAHDAPLAAAAFDVLLTDGALKFARDLRQGRPEAKADRDVDLPGGRFDPRASLAAALETHALAAFLAGLAPPQPEYARLRFALRRYRDIAAEGGWPMLEKAETDRLFSDAALSALLRRRLAYEDASASSDADLADAVKRFQLRHGLKADGRVGGQTLRALNVPASERVLEIIANMERWRWMPRTFEDRYVAVNVPDARLDLIADGKIVLSSRVIVGRRRGPTPILRAVASSVTINPPWNVPATIARKEILPKLKSNPAYLASQNMVLLNGPPDDPNGLHIDWKAVPAARFPYQIQQLPGPTNALGQIKLELPNRFAVYLHDTPAKGAFDLDQRYLSHGCVRVQDIKALASYALAGDVTSAVADIDTAVAAGTTQHLPLGTPLPIYLLYWTAFADDYGAVEFRDDIYGRDRRLLDALAKRAPHQQVTLAVMQCRPA